MRRKRKFRSARRIDEQIHPVTRAKFDNSLQTALRTGHFTPDAIMTLQRTAGNQAVIQRLGDGEPQTGAAAQTEAEKRLKEIIASLSPKKKEDKGDAEQYKKALESAIKAFLATDAGKQIKKQVMEAATRKENLPLTIVVASGIVAALFAQNAGIPSIPDIPIGEGMSLNIDLDGTMQEPTGIKFSFKFKFGGGKKKSSSGGEKVTELPPAIYAVIKDLDERLISEWTIARAQHEYEMAGPDQQNAEKQIFDELKADAEGLPNTHLVVEALARKLLEHTGESRIEFDMGYGEVWNSFYDLSGLVGILHGLVELIVPALPEPAQSIQLITFKVGKKVIPVPVKRPEKEAE